MKSRFSVTSKVTVHTLLIDPQLTNLVPHLAASHSVGGVLRGSAITEVCLNHDASEMRDAVRPSHLGGGVGQTCALQWLVSRSAGLPPVK